MADRGYYDGQRRSYAGGLCTVRYFGPLSSTKGDWLGVEWDDPSRGKHDGLHEGRRIFRCLSSSATVASFVRPSRKPDAERTLLEAIQFKYAPGIGSGRDAAEDTIEISGKIVEEIGFEKIQKQMSVLTDLKIVLADELVISSLAERPASPEELRDAQHHLGQTCPNIVELDIGWNIIENWEDVVDMCAPLKKLKILKAGGLRLRVLDATVPASHSLRNIEELYLNENLLTPAHIIKILFFRKQCNFGSLRTLSLSLNELESLEVDGDAQGLQCFSVTTVILENNKFKDLSLLPRLFGLFPSLTSLSLQGNAISRLGLDSLVSLPTLKTLNLAGNNITDYSFIDSLPKLFPNLTSLRISRNPLYLQSHLQDEADDASSGARGSQAAGAKSDSTSYYLTLARIPGLKSLNYTNISQRDREEGEIYYLSVAEKEIRSLLEDTGSDAQDNPGMEGKVALARHNHPLYSPLCAKYDREDILQAFLNTQSTTKAPLTTVETKSHLDTYAPGTLGSRLVDAYFYIPLPLSSTHIPFHRPLPTTISVYRLKSLIARHFHLPALSFRLIYESHEYDPVEPIHSTRNTGAGQAGSNEEAWAGWGDWDVDNSDVEDHDDEDADGVDDGVSEAEKGHAMPAFIMREGHRFKKRETEILDGMRPWGDFLDVDAAMGERRRRDVRIRVEPFERGER